MDLKQFVIIVGNDFSISDRDPNEYISRIVYGSPKVTTVVNNGHFVALCEYTNEDTQAHHTYDRMGSFPYGAYFAPNVGEAHREFGAWLSHYAISLEMAQPKPSWITTAKPDVDDYDGFAR